MKTVAPLTLAQAKSLGSGTTIYHRSLTDSRGYPTRVKTTSVKTWKTRPNEVLVGWKYGLYEYGSFTQSGLDDWSLDEPERVVKVGSKRRRTTT